MNFYWVVLQPLLPCKPSLILQSPVVHFVKYHALGNDYLVYIHNTPANESVPSAGLNVYKIQHICNRHTGLGADGILVPSLDVEGHIAVCIYNPDGSEAEKSGNGLRIFARWLFDVGRACTAPFDVHTAGGIVSCMVMDRAASQVQVDISQVTFEHMEMPLQIGNTRLRVNIVSIGNPHCVILRDHLSAAETQALGPRIETHRRFPKRTNVQFVRVLDRQHLQLEIWERGAGYTLASGSSSCAAAAVAVRLGLCKPMLTVSMPGGDLAITVSPDFQVRMTGPVVRVATIELDDDVVAAA